MRGKVIRFRKQHKSCPNVYLKLNKRLCCPCQHGHDRAWQTGLWVHTAVSFISVAWRKNESDVQMTECRKLLPSATSPFELPRFEAVRSALVGFHSCFSVLGLFHNKSAVIQATLPRSHIYGSAASDIAFDCLDSCIRSFSLCSAAGAIRTENAFIFFLISFLKLYN